MATICHHHVVSLYARAEGERPAPSSRRWSAPVLILRSKSTVASECIRTRWRGCLRQCRKRSNDEFMGFTQNNCKVGLFATMAELVSHCTTLGELLAKAVHFYNLVSSDIPMQLAHRGWQCRAELYHGPTASGPGALYEPSSGW